MENASQELNEAHRQLAREPVAPEMKAEVERFYRDEFVPVLVKSVNGPRPKEACFRRPRRVCISTTTTSQQVQSHTARNA